MPAFELPLAQNRGIPSEPLKLRVTGCLTPRGAERLYIAALTSELNPAAASRCHPSLAICLFSICSWPSQLGTPRAYLASVN
jgi:hypothetical protein